MVAVVVGIIVGASGGRIEEGERLLAEPPPHSPLPNNGSMGGIMGNKGLEFTSGLELEWFSLLGGAGRIVGGCGCGGRDLDWLLLGRGIVAVLGAIGNGLFGGGKLGGKSGCGCCCCVTIKRL
jgi:hypothetical protein